MLESNNLSLPVNYRLARIVRQIRILIHSDMRRRELIFRDLLSNNL